MMNSRLIPFLFLFICCLFLLLVLNNGLFSFKNRLLGQFVRSTLLENVGCVNWFKFQEIMTTCRLKCQVDKNNCVFSACSAQIRLSISGECM